MATIPTPQYPRLVAAAPGGDRLYFVADAPALLVADTSTNTVVASVALDGSPLAIAVAPSGARAYAVLVTGSGSSLAVVDLNSLTVLSSIPVCDGAYKIAMAPDGSRLYLMSGSTNAVCVFDPVVNAVTGTIALPPSTVPTSSVVSADGSRLYLAYTRAYYDPTATGDHLAVIDVATTSPIAVLDTPFGVYDLVLAPDGSRIYVPDGRTALVILDLNLATATGTINLHAQAGRMVISPEGRRIFVNYPYKTGAHINYFDQTGVVDTLLGRELTTVTVGSFPMDLALTPVLPPGRVFVDIRPNSLANNVNPSGTDRISVAVLSSPSFDASTVDRASIAFGRTGIEAPPLSCSPSLSDVNGDGLPDLVCDFDESATGFLSGDSTGYWTGRTVSGSQLRGFDAVNVQ